MGIAEYSIPTGFLDSPSAITSGPDGALWFTEYNGFKIGRITISGSFTEYFLTTGPAGEPAGITSGPDGALWFTLPYGNAIGRITTTGEIAQFALPNPGSEPQGIVAGPDGALWFTEASGNRIGRISTSGAITEYPVPTPNSGPDSITAGSDGALWFVEDNSNANQIGRVTTSGSITEYPALWPGSITLGPDGALWFTQPQLNQIARMTTAGVVTATFSANAGDITTGPDGALWYTSIGEIGRMTTSGAVTVYSLPTVTAGPAGITTGPDGRIWFTESVSDRIAQMVQLTANLAVSPATGAYRVKLNFSGSGFMANEPVKIYTEGIGSPVLAKAQADSSGSFATAVPMPPLPYGTRLFLGMGQESGLIGGAGFSVTPRVTLTPSSGPAGSVVTAQGYGFPPGHYIEVNWEGRNPSTLGAGITDGNGSLTGTGAITFTIPANAAPGAHRLMILDADDQSILLWSSFTVQ